MAFGWKLAAYSCGGSCGLVSAFPFQPSRATVICWCRNVDGMNDASGAKEESKRFFFEKKKQKTFAIGPGA
jgi:hypothetical protein